jgi:hypothetical protein
MHIDIDENPKEKTPEELFSLILRRISLPIELRSPAKAYCGNDYQRAVLLLCDMWKAWGEKK